jgi:hypothetical protein
MILIRDGESIDSIAEYIMKNNNIIDKQRAVALAQEFTYKFRTVRK